jgi:chromosome partitioning protein
MVEKIVVANQKGGVGKTTTSVNVGAFLAGMGNRVLLIDLCPQANLTTSFGIDICALDRSLSEVILDKCTPLETVVEVLPKLSLLPCRPDIEHILSTAPIASNHRKNELLKFKMGNLEEDYDFIVIDTGPAARSVLTTNGLAIADYVLVPITFEEYAVNGLKQIRDAVNDVKNQFINYNLKILGIFATFYQCTNNCKKYQGIVQRSKFGEVLLKSKIRRNVSLSASVGEGKPITAYDRRSNGYKDYEELTREILERLAVPRDV